MRHLSHTHTHTRTSNNFNCKVFHKKKIIQSNPKKNISMALKENVNVGKRFVFFTISATFVTIREQSRSYGSL